MFIVLKLMPIRSFCRIIMMNTAGSPIWRKEENDGPIPEIVLFWSTEGERPNTLWYCAYLQGCCIASAYIALHLLKNIQYENMILYVRVCERTFGKKEGGYLRGRTIFWNVIQMQNVSSTVLATRGLFFLHKPHCFWSRNSSGFLRVFAKY